MTDIEYIDYIIKELSNVGADYDEVVLDIKATADIVRLLLELKERKESQ